MAGDGVPMGEEMAPRHWCVPHKSAMGWHDFGDDGASCASIPFG